jgi:hypothetical protein
VLLLPQAQSPSLGISLHLAQTLPNAWLTPVSRHPQRELFDRADRGASELHRNSGFTAAAFLIHNGYYLRPHTSTSIRADSMKLMNDMTGIKNEIN